MGQAPIDGGGGAVMSNTTGDVYRSGNTPPAAPDVAGVNVLLLPDFSESHLAQTTSATTLRWTHRAAVPLATDIRDAYQGGLGGETIGAAPDAIYVPDKNGTKFLVVFVERVRSAGATGDYKQAYLQRQAVTWPSQNL
jgi:hypothetical protein